MILDKSPYEAEGREPAPLRVPAVAAAYAGLAVVDARGRMLLARKAALSHLGPFPSEFSSFNDMALKHVLPILVREQRRALADLESDLPHVADTEAAALVKGLVELKRQHL